MKRYVTLGDGRAVGLGNYVKAWKTALSAPADARFKGKPSDPTGWMGGYDRAEVLREFRDGLHDRINRHIPDYGKGRKWDRDWFWMMWRAARDLNTPRLAIHWLPPELRERFEHRMATY